RQTRRGCGNTKANFVAGKDFKAVRNREEAVRKLGLIELFLALWRKDSLRGFFIFYTWRMYSIRWAVFEASVVVGVITLLLSSARQACNCAEKGEILPI
ncbi:MAG: hypothetical protein ACYS8Y_08360, partial [Planctomycetota bacterium]